MSEPGYYTGPIKVLEKTVRDMSKRDALHGQALETQDPAEREYLMLAAALEEEYAEEMAGAQDIVQENAQRPGGAVGLAGPGGIGAMMRRGVASTQATQEHDRLMNELRRKYGKSGMDTFNAGAATFYGA